jgi:hypothetical protein
VKDETEMNIGKFAMAALLVLLANGCSTFNYEWRREAGKPPSTNQITGRWEGQWISEASGHNDALRCLISRQEDGRFRARFRATYEHVLHFSYTVLLDGRYGTDGVGFDGTADLGKIAGGVYHYKGYANGTNFFSTYRSQSDHGTFRMRRPPIE